EQKQAQVQTQPFDDASIEDTVIPNKPEPKAKTASKTKPKSKLRLKGNKKPRAKRQDPALKFSTPADE
ncbi:MAG: hypothetical protein ACPHV3_05780, partial [Vibrio sp.]